MKKIIEAGNFSIVQMGNATFNVYSRRSQIEQSFTTLEEAKECLWNWMQISPEMVSRNIGPARAESIPALLEKYGVDKKYLSDRFGIPYRTIQKWCAPVGSGDHRECPRYQINMMDELLSNDHNI